VSLGFIDFLRIHPERELCITIAIEQYRDVGFVEAQQDVVPHLLHLEDKERSFASEEILDRRTCVFRVTESNS
jgi:hypothetical protein